MNVPIGLSINERQNSVGNLLAVLFPVLSVLLSARNVVTPLSVDEQWSQIRCVGEREIRAESTRQSPRPRHHDIAKVVHVASVLPPSIKQQLRTTLCLQIVGIRQLTPRKLREVADFVASTLLAEVILLAVGSVKDPVSNDVHERNRDSKPCGVFHGTNLVQVESLHRENERHHDQVEHQQHPAKLLVNDIHAEWDARFSLVTRVHEA